jgi:hypothetical protein
MNFFSKNLVIITIVLLADLNTYTITPEPIIAAMEGLMDSISATASSSGSVGSFDVTPYNSIAETATERIVLQTTTYENKITLAVDYHHKETGLTAHAEKQLYPNNSLDNESTIDCDLSLFSPNSDIAQTSNASNDMPQEPDILNDLLNDSAYDARRQGMDENHATQSHDIKQSQKVIREQDLQKDKLYFRRDFSGIPLDSDLLMKKPSVFHDPRRTLSSPVIGARFDRLVTFYKYKANLNSKFQSELTFCQALKSGKVLDLFNQIYSADLATAEKAFNQLKELWIRYRKYNFLKDKPYNTRELEFLTNVGFDIMGSAERALVTRQDYILKYADAQSLKKIQEYEKYCRQLQQAGNKKALFDEAIKLRAMVTKRSDFATKIRFATAQKTLFDPATEALHKIAHAPSLEKACTDLKNLESRLLTQAQRQNIMSESQMRAWTVEHYGYDLLEAAHNCYKSRPDYVYTPENQSYLSDPINPILRNIESKDLPRAHAELVNLDKQINQVLADHNITEPMAQKAFIEKVLGRDVSEIAHKKYEARADHKKLVESFMDIDVNKSAASILQNNKTYESVADEMSNLAERIFGNARLCNLRDLPKIESHVQDSIDGIRSAQDYPTFIFNFSMVNRVLGDIQQLAHAVLSGTHPVMQQSSELLIEGFKAFFEGLNPVEQIKGMGHLALEIGAFLDKSGTALWNDPIMALSNGMNATCSLIDLIRSTADFTSDLTVGRLYLSPQDYQQRIDTFCALIEPLRGITGQECCKFAGQLVMDFLLTNGVTAAYKFLKRLNALEKLGESAARVASALKKGFDAHLADNPVVITAEGIVLKMSNGMKDFNKGPREIINSTKALFESVYAPIALKLEKTIAEIRTFYLLKPNHDFTNFGNRHIKIALEHILGVELKWSELGSLLDLSGFHHDFMGAVEKSRAFKFLNKVMNENGCYSADIVLEGRTFPKTFFPQHWTQKEVADKIYEAYYNYIKSGATLELGRGGKYFIKGFTNEGIKIEMYITQKGLITTAYPVFK